MRGCFLHVLVLVRARILATHSHHTSGHPERMLHSQLTGIYGGAVLIGRAEHTATVPLNRAASMLAGLIGSVLLGQHITRGQAAGFALLLLAVLILRKR